MITSPATATRSRLHSDVDAEVGDALIEVKIGASSLRTMNSALMKLAAILGNRPGFKGYLALADSAITLPRLQEEWISISRVLRPEILERLTVCILKENQIMSFPRELDPQTQSIISATVEKERRGMAATRAPRSSELFYDILRILINQWIKRAGPLTSRWLAEAAGCTYPTVASALEKLEKYLARHSDRRVELKAFPKDEWFRLVANADKVRQTLRFTDRSGQPRSVESLVSRLQKLHPDGVAIAGVLGARRLFPAIDLIGTPRLDLTLHCRTRQPDLGFLRQLDPALKPAGSEEPARLVIHLLRSPHVFFETDPDSVLWADPVECLLDLHEMRLESQALEFLHALTPKGGTA